MKSILKKIKGNLKNWVVTEYEWPSVKTHTDYIEAGNPWDKKCKPPHTRLQTNKQFLIKHGARFVNGQFDGTTPVESMNKFGLLKDIKHPNNVDLVSWGSPHACLPSLDASSDFLGSHVLYKSQVFHTLCDEFKHSVVIMTVSSEKPTLLPVTHEETDRSYHRLRVYMSGSDKAFYVPRCSAGEERCARDQIHALICVPEWAEAFFASAYHLGIEQHGAFDLSQFVFDISNRQDHKMNLFIGEEAADLSTSLARYFVKRTKT